MEIAAFYSQEAYRKKIPEAIRIENKLVGSACHVIRMESYDLFAFRGTDNLNDWLVNGFILPVPSGGGWCHAGFVSAYKTLKKQALKFARPFRPTIVTGHSLGGAMAERFCMDLGHMREVHLVTFGKPNLRFKPKRLLLKHLKTQLSVINGSDIVPRVPRYMYGPDPGQDVWYFPNEGNPYLGRYSIARAKMREDWGLADTTRDHNMSDYRENVRRVE